MSFYPRRPPPSPPRGKSEFEILKSAHKFLRPDEESDASKSWDDQLARKYYDSLYKEYALCDLKHYKSGNFALRWRTENEVLSGAGEETCGNTRCSHHDRPDSGVKLTPVELPFVYAEEGQTKSALVKVVLCRKCLDKLMYKHRKEKERALPPAPESARQVKLEEDDDVREFTPGPPAASDDRGDGYRGSEGHNEDDRGRRERRRAWEGEGARAERPRIQPLPSPSPPRNRSRHRRKSPSSRQPHSSSHRSHSETRRHRHSRSRSPESNRQERPSARRW